MIRAANDALKRHLATVDETYFEHMSHTFGLSGVMIGVGAACLVHGVLPFLFENKASRTIEDLYHRQVLSRDPRSLKVLIVRNALPPKPANDV